MNYYISIMNLMCSTLCKIQAGLLIFQKQKLTFGSLRLATRLTSKQRFVFFLLICSWLFLFLSADVSCSHILIYAKKKEKKKEKEPFRLRNQCIVQNYLLQLQKFFIVFRITWTSNIFPAIVPFLDEFLSI